MKLIRTLGLIFGLSVLILVVSGTDITAQDAVEAEIIINSPVEGETYYWCTEFYIDFEVICDEGDIGEIAATLNGEPVNNGDLIHVKDLPLGEMIRRLSVFQSNPYQLILPLYAGSR